MKLRDLRKFILIKSAEGSHAEIRACVTENLDPIAGSLHVSTDTLMRALESVPDDAELAARLLETIMRAEDTLNRARKERRSKAAQESATLLASTVRWQGEKACIDMPALLSSTLTRRQDTLVFTGEDFTVSIPMAPLLDLSRIARVRADLTGFVDKDGLHLRWKTGALNLRSREGKPRAEKVIVHVPARVSVEAA